MDSEPNGNLERLRLLKITNRLSVAFTAWAIVVAVVGSMSLWYLAQLRDDNRTLEQRQVDDHAAIVLIKERQDINIRRIDRLEDRQQ